MLQNSKARVECGLQTLHHIEQLLDLRLQLDDFFGGGMRGKRQSEQDERGGGK
jgi:hypothetical protein